MKNQLKQRFSKFENVNFFYCFFKQTINWLCQNFFNEKLSETTICYFTGIKENLKENMIWI